MVNISGSEPRSPESNFRLLIALLIVVLVLLVLILVLGYFVYKKYKGIDWYESM